MRFERHNPGRFERFKINLHARRRARVTNQALHGQATLGMETDTYVSMKHPRLSVAILRGATAG